MYEDEVRIFVEVGPKGNLTGFVNDILGDRSYLAVPTNSSSRSGITQLNHLIGMLAAHHVPMQLDYLYKYRSPKRTLSDESIGEPNGKTHFVKLSMDYPLLKLPNGNHENGKDSHIQSPQVVSTASLKENGTSKAEVASSFAGSNGVESALITRASEARTHSGSNGQGSGHDSGQRGAETPTSGYFEQGSRMSVMDEYLQTVDLFVKTQQDVVSAYLTSARQRMSGVGPLVQRPSAFAPPHQASSRYDTFNIKVQSMTDGREVEAT
jgi:acyl transferase domain-containing protein